MQIDTPTTRHPILVNSVGNPTRHSYRRSEELPMLDANGKPDGSHVVHFYTCDVTGAERRYGASCIPEELPSDEEISAIISSEARA